MRLLSFYKKLNKNQWFEPIFVIGMSLIITFGIVFSVHSIFGQQEISIANNTAEEYFYQGNYDEAITEYTKMQKDDKWPIWTVKVAEIYSIKGDLEKSNSLLKEAVLVRNKLLQENDKEYLDRDEEFINEVVINFFMNGQYEEALSLGEDYIINNNGEYKPLIKTMFAIYMAVGEVDNAKETVKMYKVDDASAYDMALYANMQMMVGDIKDGINTLKAAFELDKNEIKIVEVLSEMVEFNRSEILEVLTELLNSNKSDEGYNLLLAQIYSLDKNEYNNAETILNSLQESLEETLNYKYVKAQLYKNMGRYDEVEELFDKVTVDDSYFMDYIKASKYYANKEYDMAMEYSKESILKNRQYTNTYVSLIPEILMATKNTTAIEGYFRIAMKNEPFNYNMILKIANNYVDKLSKYDKSLQQYELVLKFKPEEAELYYELGKIEITQKNSEKAVEYLQKAISLDDKNGNYYRTLGKVYLDLGEVEKSIESTRYAYSLDETDVLSLNNVACYYMTIESDIWRGFSNIEAAYEEMPEDIDGNSKDIITENYNKTKKLFNDYSKDESKEIEFPEFKFFY